MLVATDGNLYFSGGWVSENRKIEHIIPTLKRGYLKLPIKISSTI